MPPMYFTHHANGRSPERGLTPFTSTVRQALSRIFTQYLRELFFYR